jgi:signal transduction histidine kinase
MKQVSTIIGLSTIAVEKVLDFLPYPFLVSEWRDGHQRNLYANKAFIEEIGFTCQDIPTITDWFELAYPEIRYRHEVMLEWEQTRLRAIEQGKEAVIVKAKIETKSRGPQWYEVKASLSGKLEMIAFVNINEEIIKELKLEQLNEDKNRILSVLSHDLRAPLGNLHALTGLSNDGMLSQSEFNACVNKIGASTLNIMEFLDTTLQWTRANFEGIHPTISSVHLPDMINKICSLYEKSCQDKKIEIRTNLLLADLDSDPEIISIVVRNVLSNANKVHHGRTN